MSDTPNKIQRRYKNFIACPCCGQPIKVLQSYRGRIIPIEPIHIEPCSICGGFDFETKNGMHGHHEKYDDGNPLDNIVSVCTRCHLEITKKERINRPLAERIKDLLDEMGLNN